MSDIRPLNSGVLAYALCSIFLIAAILAGATQEVDSCPLTVQCMDSDEMIRDRIPLRAAGADDIAEMFAITERMPSSSDAAAVIDGHGTGLTAPSAEYISSLEGRQIMLDEGAYVLDSLPTSIDLSTRLTFPVVGDQGSQNSCAAWASAYYAYGFAEAEDNGWIDASLGNPEHLISPAWTYNKVKDGRDTGSSVHRNMQVILDWGSATMATMPYDEDDCMSWGTQEAYREAPLHRAEYMGLLSYTGSSTIDVIKQLLIDGVPMTFYLDAGEFSEGFSDGNYIISSDEYSSLDLGHVQTIVGYDDAVSDDGENGAFRVVNSWGAEWGDGGYYWFTFDAFTELGDLGLLMPQFILDIEDYSPSLLAVWQFDEPPSRSIYPAISIGLPILTYKSPITDSDYGMCEIPTFMCLDITEFEEFYPAYSDRFRLVVSSHAPQRSMIASFKIEHYESSYAPGMASQSSGQSLDIPMAIPGTVSVDFPYHPPILLDEALDLNGVEVTGYGAAQWVAVNHEYSVGGDSAQSGNIGDSGYSALQIPVTGPVYIEFDWKVSSQIDSDWLSFEVDGVGVIARISGSVDWTTQVYSLGPGEYTLIWTYSKDDSGCALDDSGWIDNLIISPMAVPLSSA